MFEGKSVEGRCADITLQQILDSIEHKRKLILAVLLKNVNWDELKPEEVYIKQEKTDSNEKMTMDHCFQAFNREEMLRGDDKWYCSNCKEHQNALKSF